jgi:hypothetical protein
MVERGRCSAPLGGDDAVVERFRHALEDEPCDDARGYDEDDADVEAHHARNRHRAGVAPFLCGACKLIVRHRLGLLCVARDDARGALHCDPRRHDVLQMRCNRQCKCNVRLPSSRVRCPSHVGVQRCDGVMAAAGCKRAQGGQREARGGVES